MKRFISKLLAVFVLTLFVSCQKDISSRKANIITLDVQISDNTKADRITASDLSFLSSFKMWVYDSTSTLYDNVDVINTANGWKIGASPKTWIDNTTLTFLATANIPSWAETTSSSKTTHVLSINSIPSDATNHKDPLVGFYQGTGNDGKALITFYHPLTAVSFTAGILGETFDGISGINSITIKDAYVSGTLTASPNSTNLSFAWTGLGTSDVTADFSLSGTEFIVIPVETPTDFTISVEFNLTAGGTKTVETKINSLTWLAGKINRYVLEYENNTLKADLIVTLDAWENFNFGTSQDPQYYYDAHFN